MSISSSREIFTRSEEEFLFICASVLVDLLVSCTKSSQLSSFCLLDNVSIAELCCIYTFIFLCCMFLPVSLPKTKLTVTVLYIFGGFHSMSLRLVFQAQITDRVISGSKDA